MNFELFELELMLSNTILKLLYGLDYGNTEGILMEEEIIEDQFLDCTWATQLSRKTDLKKIIQHGQKVLQLLDKSEHKNLLWKYR